MEDPIILINKPWGNELWISDGSITPYAIKRILFRAKNRTSLQVHQFKIETNYVLSGTGILLKSIEAFQIDEFLKTGMPASEIVNYENRRMVKIDLYPGVVVNIPAGYVHRVTAKTDLEFIEVSTPELDDVIRLQDDNGRAHGKILSEHTQ